MKAQAAERVGDREGDVFAANTIPTRFFVAINTMLFQSKDGKLTKTKPPTRFAFTDT